MNISSDKISEEHTSVDGIDAYYVLAGRGPPVILLHCLWAPSAWPAWSCNIPTLATRFQIYAVDMIGFGHSGKPKLTYSLSCFAHFLNRFVTIQGIPKVDLIGWSYAGNIAIQFALDFPEKINKLVLVDAVLCRQLRSRHRIALGKLSLPIVSDLLIKRMLARESVRRTYLNFFCDKRYVTNELIDKIYGFLNSVRAQKTFLATARCIGSFSGFRKESRQFYNLERINAETLIMGATNSHRPVTDAEIAHEKIRNSRVVILENCAHAMHIEKAKEFNRVVLDFLSIND